MGNLSRCEALAGGAFDVVNCQYSGEFDQIFFKKVKWGGGGGLGMGALGFD